MSVVTNMSANLSIVCLILELDSMVQQKGSKKMLTALQQNGHKATKTFFGGVAFFSLNVSTCRSFADGNRGLDGLAGGEGRRRKHLEVEKSRMPWAKETKVFFSVKKPQRDKLYMMRAHTGSVS